MNRACLLPRLWAGVAVAALALLALVGCDRRPSTAAYVGSTTISAHQLDQTINAGWASKPIKAAWSDQAAYRRQVLDNEIYHAVLVQVAASRGLRASDAEATDVLKALRTQVQTSSQLDKAFAQLGYAPAQVGDFARDIALTGEVAIKAGLAYTIGIIETPNAATARRVARRIASDEAAYESLATRYANAQNTLQQPQLVTKDQVVQAFGKEGATARPGDTFTIPVPGGSGTVAVVHLFSTNLSLLPSAARAVALLNLYRSGRIAIGKGFHGRIRVNPRFGRWDAGSGKVGESVNPAVIVPKSAKPATR